ncbi:hypothetical protein HanPI659440_Chr14g0562521 [Helianthus annuus]|nr:hypothetical protein HanPI659440_Chr14g0562521 [Helianthus annuus]
MVIDWTCVLHITYCQSLKQLYIEAALNTQRCSHPSFSFTYVAPLFFFIYVFSYFIHTIIIINNNKALSRFKYGSP